MEKPSCSAFRVITANFRVSEILGFLQYIFTVMTLKFWTDRSGQTVQTRIKLLLRKSLIRVYTVCHSVSIFLTHQSIVKPPCSNFRVITANVSGVSILGFLQYIIGDNPRSQGLWDGATYLSCLVMTIVLLTGPLNLKSTCQHMSHDTTKPTKWVCAQRRLWSDLVGPVWSVFAVRSMGS